MWQQLRTVEHTTENSDGPRVERWLKPRWESMPLGRIEPEHVELWVIDLSQHMQPASVARTYGIFRSSVTAAVKYKRLGVSPCQGIELPTVPPPDERFLTRSEVDRALHFMVEPYRTAVIVLVGTGMRFGEMAGLHWHRVHSTMPRSTYMSRGTASR